MIRCKVELYSYSTLYCGGVAAFLLICAVEMLSEIIALSNANHSFNVIQAVDLLRNSGSAFMLWTAIPALIFSAVLTVSNIVLIRREGKRLTNLLGFAMSIALVGGDIGMFFVSMLFSSGSELNRRLNGAVSSVYAAICVYMQAMLFSAAVCGLIAAKKKPSTEKTHTIILGCSIAKDGTPLPLLRGRIDRAMEFARMQKAQTGRDVIFVPSGGQGSDEVLSEADSMRNYLCAQGIPEAQIIPERKSTNTKENMRFSLKKITADCAEPRILFSTSDYHVLRSGIISQSEGLNAEGIGSRTKWYFWPNAFIREFVGLLWRKRRHHLLCILALTAFFAAANMLIPF